MAFAGAEKLLDFNQPFDVPLLDQIVNAFYAPGGDPSVVRPHTRPSPPPSSYADSGADTFSSPFVR